MPNRGRDSGSNERPMALVQSDEGTHSTIKNLTKKQFGNHLYHLILEKGWRQSDLARASGLPKDSISTYVRGKVFPTHHSLLKIAEALDIEVEELAPGNSPAPANKLEKSGVQLMAHPSKKGMGLIFVDRLVTMKTALRIMDLLESDNATDAGGSGAAPAVLTNDNKEASD